MKRLTLYCLLLPLVALATTQGHTEPTWSDRLNGFSSGYDDAGSICADANGNVYVGGLSQSAGNASSFAVISYSPSGNRKWISHLSGGHGKATALVVDSQGNVYASGYRYANPGVEEVLAKFNPKGIQQWTRRLQGRPVKLIPDSAGSLYVVGTYNDGYDSDWSTSKFSSNGDLLWDIRYDTGHLRNDVPSNGILDANGNLVVAGTIGTSNNLDPGDVLVAAYSPKGHVIWQDFYTVESSSHEFVDDFGIDADGNVIVVGGTAESASIYVQARDLWLKYDPKGRLIGSATGSPCPNDDVGGAVVDEKGNLYSVTFSRIVKFSPDGEILWRKEISNPQLGISVPKIALRNSDEIVVGGTSFDGTFRGDYVLFGYSLEGTLRWTGRFDGPLHGDDTLEAMCIAPGGIVCVTGTTWNGYGSAGGTADDIVTLKYSH